MRSSIGRGIALFLGGFTLLNLAGDALLGRNDANLWWISFWPLPDALAYAMLLLVAATSIVWALHPRRYFVNELTIIVTLLAALGNTIRYYVLLGRGDIHSRLPVPLSLLVALVLAFLFVAQREEPRLDGRAFALAFVAAGIVFPLAQIACFGLTDYRRPADVVVVFGARANADGTPSPALADRVRTACDLHRAGLARQLVFSGGPGLGAFDEPEVMRRYATSLGVPAADITLDHDGINTESTVRNTVATLRGQPLRVIAVSHFYHLPRIKMTFQRYGVDVFTVPSRNEGVHPLLINLTREDAAFWRYYLRRLAAQPPVPRSTSGSSEFLGGAEQVSGLRSQVSGFFHSEALRGTPRYWVHSASAIRLAMSV